VTLYIKKCEDPCILEAGVGSLSSLTMLFSDPGVAFYLEVRSNRRWLGRKRETRTARKRVPGRDPLSLGFRSPWWINASRVIDGGNKPPVPPIGLVSGCAVATAARAQTHTCCRVKMQRLCPIPDKAEGGREVPGSFLVLLREFQ
jgi:hypothetical protein